MPKQFIGKKFNGKRKIFSLIDSEIMEPQIDLNIKVKTIKFLEEKKSLSSSPWREQRILEEDTESNNLQIGTPGVLGTPCNGPVHGAHE